MGFCPKGKTEVNQCVKYLLLFGTFLHWVLGLGMVVVGSYAYIETNKYFYQPIENVYDVIFDLSIVLIAFGGIMFFLNIFGFLGTLRENTCLIKTFVYILLVIVIIELVCGVLCLAFKQKAIDLLSKVLKDVYILDYQDDVEGLMDFFQETWKCCGVSSYQDYEQNQYFNCTDSNPSQIKCAVPYSCCKDPDELTPGLNNILCGGDALAKNSATVSKIWTEGCVTTLVNLADQNLPIIGGVLIAVAVPQLLGIFLGNMLVNQIKTQWRIYQRDMARQRVKDMRYNGYERSRY